MDVDLTTRALRRQLCDTFRRLAPQDLLEECCKAAIYLGEYKWLAKAGRPTSSMLDAMNYSPALFEEVLPLMSLSQIFGIRPGYGTVPGEDEIGPVVRAYELSRANAFCKSNNLRVGPATSSALQNAAVVSTAGATGAVNIALRAIIRRHESASASKRTVIVYNAPCYPLAEAHARRMGLKTRPVVGQQHQGYLPSPSEIMEACKEDVLVCLLTLPTNPTQVSWTIDQYLEAKQLIKHCQSNDIVLIFDSIFEDLCWQVPSIEVFSVAEDTHNLIKVFSPSKDRPGANGLRIGYLIGDPRFRSGFESEKLEASNSSSTFAQAWLAFDLVFRQARIAGGLAPELFETLAHTFVMGYDAPRLSSHELFRRCDSSGIYLSYQNKLDNFLSQLDESLYDVHTWIKSSICFEVSPRPPYGNTIVVTVRREYSRYDAIKFFVECLADLAVSASIGECFEFPSDGRIRFRIVGAGRSSRELIENLSRIQHRLLEGGD